MHHASAAQSEEFLWLHRSVIWWCKRPPVYNSVILSSYDSSALALAAVSPDGLGAGLPLTCPRRLWPLVKVALQCQELLLHMELSSCSSSNSRRHTFGSTRSRSRPHCSGKHHTQVPRTADNPCHR